MMLHGSVCACIYRELRNNILMSSLLIFVIQLSFLVISALALHSISPRVGLVPVLFFISGCMALLNIVEILSLSLEVMPGVVLHPHTHTFVPTILMLFLVLYIIEGTRVAQLVWYGLAGINVLTAGIVITLLLYQVFNDPALPMQGWWMDREVLNVDFFWSLIASAVTFILDMIIIVIAYQGQANLLPRVPRWVRAGVALLIALWMDAILYNLLLSIFTQSFVTIILGDILAKTLAGIIVWGFLAVYLVYFIRRIPYFTDTDERETFDFLFGAFGRARVAIRDLETELRTSRLTYEQLTEQMGEIFWLADDNGILYVSKAFETITGYPRDVLYTSSETRSRLIHPEDRESVAGGFIEYLMKAEDTEFRLVREDGEIRWLRNRAFQITDEQATVQRYAGLAQDITHVKAAQDNEIALAMEREQLQIIQNFVRDASHDLKTPLSTILIKTDLLQRTTDPERQQRHMAQLRERVQELAHMIDEIFTLSKVETLDDASREKLTMNEVLENVVETIRPLAEEKDLQLVSNYDAQLCFILGNKGQLRRLFSNLIGNAIRYTEQGSVRIQTHTELDRVVVIISDTGIGISPEDIPYIFDRFFRASTAKHLALEGTGLGLSICKAILEQHNGTIEVESAVKVGTRFTVTLPCSTRDVT